MVKSAGGDEFFDLITNLIQHTQLLNKDDKFCYGLTMPQSYIIEILSRDGELTTGDLSVKMGVAISTMTRVLNILERDKLVKRNTGKKDKRQVIVSLTDSGKSTALKLKKCRVGAINILLQFIPEKDRPKVVSSVKIINKAMNEASITAHRCCIP